jgi:lactose/L-arabinose transport system ATP-binding protein
MVYVTHDQTEAMTLADRIVVLRAGRVEQVGAPLELYNDPANQFVAGFIGSPRMNFLAAESLGSAGGPTRFRLVNQGGAEIALPLSASLPPGTPAVVGIRPEHFAAPAQATATSSSRSKWPSIWAARASFTPTPEPASPW